MNQQTLNQKYQQFKNQFLGKKIDFDGSYGYQCVDLNRYFANKVLGITMNIVGGTAYAGWLNQSNTYPSNFWQKIEKTIDVIPPTGAFIHLAPTSGNSAGHIALVDKADKNTVWFLEQNGIGGGTGIGSNAIRVQSTNYLDQKGYGKVLGWYVPKEKSASIVINIPNSNMNQLDKIKNAITDASKETGQDLSWISARHLDGDQNSIKVFYVTDFVGSQIKADNLQKEVNRLLESEVNKDKILADYKTTVETYNITANNSILDKDNLIKKLQSQIAVFEGQISTLTQNKDGWSKINQIDKDKIVELEKKISDIQLLLAKYENQSLTNGQVPNANFVGVDVATGKTIFGEKAKEVLANQIDTKSKEFVISQMPTISKFLAGFGLLGTLGLTALQSYVENPNPIGIGATLVLGLTTIFGTVLPNKK